MSPEGAGRADTRARRALVPPRYGDSIAELLPSVLGALGLPGEEDVLGLPPARRYLVLLVDGLGWNLLRGHRAQAPFLGWLSEQGRAITVGAPTTTATSLTSLGTGLPPGRHGIVGYTSRVPETGALLNALSWDQPVDPLTYQPHPTVLERAASSGVAVSMVAPRRFRASGLTQAGLRSPGFRAADTLGERVAAASAALRRSTCSLVYVYDGDLDTTGHAQGCGSAAWRHQLVHVDRLAEQLHDELPDDAAIVVTGDHGMVDVAFADRFETDGRADLLDGVEVFGGEARMRHLYTRAGAAADVAAAWSAALGPDATVLERATAVAQDWFGAVESRVLPRIGDVVVCVTGDTAVMSSRRFPQENRILGLHGALTAEELLVPLLAAPA